MKSIEMPREIITTGQSERKKETKDISDKLKIVHFNIYEGNT